jgi:hypothetical protein
MSRRCNLQSIASKPFAFSFLPFCLPTFFTAQTFPAMASSASERTLEITAAIAEEASDQTSGIELISLRTTPAAQMLKEGSQLTTTEHYWVRSPLTNVNLDRYHAEGLRPGNLECLIINNDFPRIDGNKMVAF